MYPFRNQKNQNRIIEPVKYTLDYLATNPQTRIYVGCDSQNINNVTVYVTTICYRLGKRGVHVIYYKERVKQNNDTWSRLWDECTRSVKIAEHLRQNGISVYQIDLDYNDDEKTVSNKLIKSTRGYVTGLGYNVGTKPDEVLATKAADYLTRS